eukprot:3078200-Prorocentrum_lima.AAC.1
MTLQATLLQCIGIARVVHIPHRLRVNVCQALLAVVGVPTATLDFEFVTLDFEFVGPGVPVS